MVGIDTARHAAAVMAEAYPDRMAHQGPTAIEAMFDAERFGQKNGKGFYALRAGQEGRAQEGAGPRGPASCSSPWPAGRPRRT